MFKDREFRKHIGLAIIAAAVIPYLIDPALKWFAHSLIWLSENVSAVFTKSIYRHAAVGLHEQSSFEMLGLAVYVATVFVLAMPLAVYTTQKRMARMDELDRQSELEYLGNEEGEREEPKPTGEMSSLTKLMDRVIFPVSCITAATAVLVGFVILTSDYIELQLNGSFNQRITVLAARATDQQVKELRAKWALMLAREDYEKINAEMATISKSLGVKLPATLWP